MININILSNMVIDLFALSILCILYLNMSRHYELYLLEQRLFDGLLFLDALIILIDMSMWLLDGKSGDISTCIYQFVTVCYYTLNPVICMVWYFYADFQIYKSEKRLKKLLVPMLVPVCANLILSILSPFLHLLFYIDAANVYHRGNLFSEMALVSLFYLFYTQMLIIFKYKRIQKRNFIPILFFAIPPLIGGVLQSVYYGLSLVWPCVTLSVLIIFINIQNDQLHKDYLTGLFNRRELDRYLQSSVQKIGNQLLFGIMIDVNAFKMINDIYGHNAGDQALQYIADILKKTFRKSDFIARYGGDEFVILGLIKEKSDLANAIERLKENVERFNAQKILPYEFSLSMGYDFISRQSEVSNSQFLTHLDKLMYQDKKNYTGLKRRQ